MSSTFCCGDCGLLHSSEFTVLDVSCPDCGAPRSGQSIVTCVGCSMPLSLPEVLGGTHDCRPEHPRSGVQPAVGMWVRIGALVGRVQTLGDNTCGILLPGRGVRASLRASGRFVEVSLRDKPTHAVHFIQKPNDKER